MFLLKEKKTSFATCFSIVNNTTKNKSKPTIRVNDKDMESIDNDLVAESSSHAAARTKSSNKDVLEGNSNRNNIHFQSDSNVTSAQRTEHTTPMSIDMDLDVSSANSNFPQCATAANMTENRR